MSALKWLVIGSFLVGGTYYLARGDLGWLEGAPHLTSVAMQSPFAGKLPDFTSLVERVGPAVVNVTTRSIVRQTPDIAERHFDIYRSLMGEDIPQRAVVGLGSGFVLGDDGYILTNAHVVEGADEVYVRLTGSKRDLKAKVVGTDKGTDIALLKIGARGLRVAPTGSSQALKVGDWVAAIGSPFGFDNTITAGIVSAKERHLPHGSHMPFLQTDVAINPGSSGGPLVNLHGEVVGINSKIYTRTGGYMGVSFAIPIETAIKVGAELRKRGFVARGYLGMETQSVSESLAASFQLDRPRGALVTAVLGGGPASRAGLKPGDIVLSYAGKEIAEPNDLSREVAETSPGTRADLEVWRRSASVLAAVVVVAEPQEQPTRTGELLPRNLLVNGTGLVLAEAPLDQCRDLKIEFGLVVHEIHRSAGSLQPGDVIVAVNDTEFRTRAEFNRLVHGQPDVTPVALRIVRGGRSQYVAVDLEPR